MADFDAFNGTAGQVLEQLREEPGQRASDLAKHLDLHPSTAAYHLRRLVQAERIVGEPVGRQTYYFPTGRGWCPRSRRVHAVLTDAARTALGIALEHGAVSRRAVLEAGRTRASVRWALENLVRAGALERLSWGVYVLPDGAKPCLRAALQKRGPHGCPTRPTQRRYATKSPSPSGRIAASRSG